MKVKRIRASDMREALFKVKKEIGADAVVINTRTIKRRGIFGIGRKKFIEVLASNDIEFIDPPEDAPPKVIKPSYINNEKGVHGILNKYDSQLELNILQSDIAQIKSLVNNLLRRVKYSNAADLPDELVDIYIRLMEQEVSEDLAIELTRRIYRELPPDKLRDKSLVMELAREFIARSMRLCEPIKLIDGYNMKIALVGPTGVGKTTTIAKLAADFALIKKKKVSVITIDTYRIAAVEQLKTYMEIIDIPLEVVTTPAEMREATVRQSKSDIILIDTAGRSQRDQMRIRELRTFIDAARPDEIHLVLSTTTNYKNTLDIIEKFSTIPVDKLLFTKLDEAVNFGLILNIMARLSKAVSYITTGQSVPDDIEPADSKRLAERIIGEVEGD